MYIPNPYSDAVLAAYMACMFPYQPFLLPPTYAAAAVGIARAALLVPVCAATAWNLTMLGLLAGEECASQKAQPGK
jgi:hypothetical protein